MWARFTQDPFWLLEPPYIYLMFGVACFSAAVAAMCTGKTFSGYGGWAYRAKQPAQFWWTIVIDFLATVLCIGIFLCKVYGL
jgi:hypothetical protein